MRADSWTAKFAHIPFACKIFFPLEFHWELSGWPVGGITSDSLVT